MKIELTKANPDLKGVVSPSGSLYLRGADGNVYYIFDGMVYKSSAADLADAAGKQVMADDRVTLIF